MKACHQEMYFFLTLLYLPSFLLFSLPMANIQLPTSFWRFILTLFSEFLPLTFYIFSYLQKESFQNTTKKGQTFLFFLFSEIIQIPIPWNI